MSRRQSASTILANLSAEEQQLRPRVEKLREELARSEARLEEISELLEAFGPLVGEDFTPPKRGPGRPRKDTSDAGAQAASPAPAKPGRKGRRKAAKAAKAAKAPKTGASGIHAMGIVEAALELAKQKGVTDANAGDIVEWLEEIGYTNKRGNPPVRNSVFVSLDREANLGAESGKVRVSRPDRGIFRFHY
jgi:hypothetical protein